MTWRSASCCLLFVLSLSCATCSTRDHESIQTWIRLSPRRFSTPPINHSCCTE
ncbi:hypothetical protein SCLCIDRAFT_1215041 [Scleroderma citrinum Foug A]|uniref:Uncharacterized protein n=1 Tax=Scleroderma citrinum Foug A TaxID=1036808 RepID=A0A0C3AC07_9AGAM|nr:hypothetical protein SCLCIDRAFT_1215041 [Scleroderma citrinum Foug A]